MLSKAEEADCNIVMSHPMPTMFPGESFDDKEKCLKFLKEGIHSFHLLVYLNNYIKNKFKEYLKLTQN